MRGRSIFYSLCSFTSFKNQAIYLKKNAYVAKKKMDSFYTSYRKVPIVTTPESSEAKSFLKIVFRIPLICQSIVKNLMYNTVIRSQ